MDVSRQDTRAAQTVQRVKVGMTGLALVLLLIVVASVLMRSVGRERAIAQTGGARAELAANSAQANGTDTGGEPLAQIGAAAAEGNGADLARGH